MKDRLIVFDMDGVLIDVSASYRNVVRKTAEIFLGFLKNAELLPKPLFSLADLAMVKQSGGLNNDWDLTYLVVSLLLSIPGITGVKSTNLKTAPDQPREPAEERRALEKILRNADATNIARYLGSDTPVVDYPLERLLTKRGKSILPVVRFFSRGDVGSGNTIKRIFQEVYLGGQLFRKTYRMEPLFYSGKGYIEEERLILSAPLLNELTGMAILAIATGRPLGEAMFALERFKLENIFSEVMGLEDCLAEEKRFFSETGKRISLGKPHPFMLDTLAERYKSSVEDFYFIGDMPDDMVAASRSRFPFKGIGFIGNLELPENRKKHLRELLLEKGAKMVIEEPSELKKIFE